MPARWLAIREHLFKQQKGQCAHCWRKFTSHEDMHAHHAVYSRMKGLEQWLDSVENITLLCPDCHANHGFHSSWFGRCLAWSKKIDAGFAMEKWHAEIPMLIKDNFLYIGKEENGEG
jgi:hypothetical protein